MFDKYKAELQRQTEEYAIDTMEHMLAKSVLRFFRAFEHGIKCRDEWRQDHKDWWLKNEERHI